MNGFLAETTFNEVEGNELSGLFTEFYLLTKEAENLKDDTEATKIINEVRIPKVTKRILEILTSLK